MKMDENELTYELEKIGDVWEFSKSDAQLCILKIKIIFG